MKLDAPAILRKLSEIRELIPRVPRPVNDEGIAHSRSMRDFEEKAIADAIDSMSSELSRALEDAQAKLMAEALETYYAAEKLARDPEFAHLIPHVEAMRRAYESDFGCAIPSA